jgi:hypothetical protein
MGNWRLVNLRIATIAKSSACSEDISKFITLSKSSACSEDISSFKHIEMYWAAERAVASYRGAVLRPVAQAPQNGRWPLSCPPLPKSTTVEIDVLLALSAPSQSFAKIIEEKKQIAYARKTLNWAAFLQ